MGVFPITRTVRSTTALAALVLACGSPDPEPGSVAQTQPPEAAKPKAKAGGPENTPPDVRDVRFEPDPPVPGRPVKALVNAYDPDGDEVWFEFEWKIDGRDPGEKAVGAKLDLSRAEKGQSVRLTVVASDGKSSSEPWYDGFELENRPPEIDEVDVEPGREVVSGTPVVAYPSASDPDGDSLTYRYRWLVNGRELGETGATIETKRMRRGDEIRGSVVANDGEDDSEWVEMPPIAIVNGPPRIVSAPPSDLPEGVFRYAVRAEDPDGDPSLEFRLENAPQGMRIDPYSGLITWSPSAEQAGVHAVTVFAEDLHDGVGEQVFEVRVRAPEEAAGSPAEVAP